MQYKNYFQFDAIVFKYIHYHMTIKYFTFITYYEITVNINM